MSARPSPDLPGRCPAEDITCGCVRDRRPGRGRPDQLSASDDPPYIAQQVAGKPNQPSLSLDDLAAALTVAMAAMAAMAAIVEYRDKPDEHSVVGATH
jgi:hypothetical protein